MTKNIKTFSDQEYVYLRNRLSEDISFSEEGIPSIVDKWYLTIDKNYEYGYLVKRKEDNVYGFLFVGEWAHLGQEANTDGYQFAIDEGGRKSEDVLKAMKEVATTIIDEKGILDVAIGEFTGIEGVHEFAVFFPCGDDKVDEYIEYIDEVSTKVIKKYWDWEKKNEEVKSGNNEEDIVNAILKLKENPIFHAYTIDVVVDILKKRQEEVAQ